MYSTTFTTTSNDYRLTVDASLALTAAAWLTANDCIFDRYCSAETTRFVITEIGILTLLALDKKFGTPIALSEDDLFQLEVEAALDNDITDDDSLIGALDNAIEFAEDSKEIARQAIENLDANQERLDAIANNALAKYPTLD